MAMPFAISRISRENAARSAGLMAGPSSRAYPIHASKSDSGGCDESHTERLEAREEGAFAICYEATQHRPGGMVMAVEQVEVDTLIVGAGAMGMAFADVVLSEHPRKRIAMVDRHPRPGGHWNDAYPFVSLHQPAPHRFA